MGFFGIKDKVKPSANKGVSIATLHKLECKVCPLNNLPGLKHPNMEPSGSKNPLIYILGEAPGAEEDQRGTPFVGKAGKLLRSHIPDNVIDKIRFSNCVRTRPPKNRTPEQVEMECCRPSVIRDIEATKPKAIFGMGAVPLNWAIEENGISNWRGRRFPVRIGTHVCWFYSMFHPSYVNRMKDERSGKDVAFVFRLDMERALEEVLDPDLPSPIFHSEKDALEGVEIIDGSKGEADLTYAIDYIKSLYDEKTVGLDYETNRLRPYGEGAKILSVALSRKGQSIAIALRHSQAKWTPQQLEKLEQAYEDFLYKSKCRKIAHNLSFEMEWTAYFFGEESLRAGLWGDSISQAYILDQRQGTLSLEFLCIQHFGVNIKLIFNLDTKILDKLPIDKVLTYNAVDAKYHRLLYLQQTKALKKAKLDGVYKTHLRRVPTMVLTQIKGVPVSQKKVQYYLQHFSEQLKEIEDEIAQLDIVKKYKKKYGVEFNPSSNKDVGQLIHGMLGQPGKGTDEAILKATEHEFNDLMLEWRPIAKLISTYIKPLLPGGASVYDDGKTIHPIFSTTKTRTWRTASEDPNAQNFPKREHKEIRSIIKPHKKSLKVVSFDYGQIQARNVAMESLDEALIKAFWDRYDIHAAWLDRITELYPRWISEGVKALDNKKLRKKYRDRSKNEFVFPLFFGAQPKSVSEDLEVPTSIAQKLWDEFFDQFPDIHKWHEKTKKNYLRKGYVTGKSGFRRHAPVAPNEIINTPIQSDESIIVCDAMARLSEMGEPRFQANLEIHDDLSFIWPVNEIEKNAEVVIEAMVNVPFEWAKCVPIVVEMAVGDDWGKTEDVGVYSSDTWTGTDPSLGNWSDGTTWIRGKK